MEIKKATYIISSAKVEQCPPADKAEVAFIGRSNVGKSSLINMLSGRTGLAKVSGTPGKTVLINHFIINDLMYWVDLPGYGFAKRSMSQRKSWQAMINEYLKQRENLCTVFVLVDASISPQKIDIEFMNKLGEFGVAFNIVFTKCDKETQNVVSKNIKAFLSKLEEHWEEAPQYFMTSNIKKTGRDKVLKYIDELNTIYTDYKKAAEKEAREKEKES
jgi:GTP-binding protein